MGSGSKSSDDKGRKGKRAELSDLFLSHRDRLHKALSLGIRFDGKGERKWQCNDAMIAAHATSAMSTFVENLTPNLLGNSLVKDSITIIFVALEGILQCDYEAVLRPATHCAARLFAFLGKSLSKYHLFGVVPRLLQLLFSHHVDIAKSSAMSLKYILMNDTTLKLKNKEIWNLLTETKATDKIINALQQYESGVHSGGYVIEFSSLLREILWISPQFRYPIWKNGKLMYKLGTLCETPDSSVATAIVRLYTVIALCDGVAYEILHSKGSFISNLVMLLQSSMPMSLRIETLILFQNLMRSEKGCLLLMNTHCKSVVEGIVNAMGGWRSSTAEKIPVNQMPLIIEACRTAQITKWPGRHHHYFWKLGIGSLLLDLLKKSAAQGPASCLELRSLVWDILGWLSMNNEGEFDAITTSKRTSFDKLISYACSLSVDGMLKKNPSFHDCYRFPSHMELEPMLRASLLMISSPSKYISSSARESFSDQLTDKDGKEYLEQILEFLSSYANDKHVTVPENAQVTLCLMALTCYSSLSNYKSLILERGGLHIATSIVGRCLNSNSHFSRSVLVSHLQPCPVPRACCSNHNEEEEVEHLVLLYTLQALSEILSSFISDRHPLFSKEMSAAIDFDRQSLTKDLMLIFDKNFFRGIKWYAAYCLGLLGWYGFPSKIGGKMRKALEETEFKDLSLKVFGGKSLPVHQVILLARCPSLLSQETSCVNEIGGASMNKQDSTTYKKMENEVQLSRFVEKDVLEKLLEYIYMGFFQVDDGLVKKMRILSKHCHLNGLLSMLQMEYPICGSPIPRYDLISALRPPGHLISDIILEAKETLVGWSCTTCHLSVPHAHAHKIVLCAGSTYMQAMLLSGMQESSSPTIKVSVSWKALAKLLHWFYTGELPMLEFICPWISLEKSARSDELSAYIELSWLAEYWCLDEVKEESTKLLLSCIRLTSDFPIQAIQVAVNLCQWKIVKAAVSCLAPHFSQLQESNELDNLEEDIIEELRVEHVRFSKERHASGS